MIRQSDRKNFATMCKAYDAGHLALVESKCAKTGEYRALICAIVRDNDGGFCVTPFGHMATGNPYEDYKDPTQEDMKNAI